MLNYVLKILFLPSILFIFYFPDPKYTANTPPTPSASFFSTSKRSEVESYSRLPALHKFHVKALLLFFMTTNAPGESYFRHLLSVCNLSRSPLSARHLQLSKGGMKSRKATLEGEILLNQTIASPPWITFTMHCHALQLIFWGVLCFIYGFF